MKAFLGLLLIIAGIVLGLFVGIYVMLVGGIVQFVNGVTTDPVNAADIAWGIVRVALASFAGWLSVALLAIPGWHMFTSTK